MSTVNTGKNTKDSLAKSYWAAGTSFQGQKSYHELADKPLVEVDLVEQLRSNISRLGELHGRLSYMMGEISQLTQSHRR